MNPKLSKALSMRLTLAPPATVNRDDVIGWMTIDKDVQGGLHEP
jgi:hypothetical protein